MVSMAKDDDIITNIEKSRIRRSNQQKGGGST
jgi:hypothetical protein